MKKKLFSILFVMIISFSFSTNAFAWAVISSNDSGGVLKGKPYYSSTNNQIMIEYEGNKVKKSVISFFHDKDFKSAGSTKTTVAPSGTWFSATGFSCVGWYTHQAYDGNGVLLLDYKIQIESSDIPNPKCSSNPDEDTEPPAPPPEPLPEEDGGVGCADLICECIRELLPVLNEINNSVNAFHDEFKTDKQYNLNPLPDISNLLDENRPIVNETPFYDDTIYFEDKGDTIYSNPGKLPKAPEPEHWEGFLPDDAMPPEEEFTTENELITEDELSTNDELQQDTEKQIDDELSVEEMQQSPILKQEDFSLSPVLKQDFINSSPELKIDNFKQDGELKKTHVYEQTNKYP